MEDLGVGEDNGEQDGRNGSRCTNISIQWQRQDLSIIIDHDLCKARLMSEIGGDRHNLTVKSVEQEVATITTRHGPFVTVV